MQDVRRRRHNDHNRNATAGSRNISGCSGSQRPKHPPSSISFMQWSLIMGIFYIGAHGIVVFFSNRLPVPKLEKHSLPGDFIEELSRVHLKELTQLGHRPSGSTANEVHAVNYILKHISDLKKIADPSMNIEVDIQKPTGSFSIDFLDGFASYYTNITNTVVRLSSSTTKSEDALLLNCHTDSVVGSPGASDDAVACSLLLEMMRAMVYDKHSLLLHPVIFLFNGAEENILQASHGFITQHLWAKQVKAFINLEAAGAGGKELVFQTGPENSWLLHAWSSNAPHPFGTVFAQDVFQSGVVPSDTDFRIFRDYGNVPGIDLAYATNGYVYHTVYDNVDMIQPGCIQRAGENILAVTNHLVKSPSSLLSKAAEYKHGKAAFFDFLGLHMFFVPLRILGILNIACCVASLIYLGQRLMFPAATHYEELVYGKQLLKASAVIILAWLASIILACAVAVILTYLGKVMSFYSHPMLAMLLYVPAALVGILLVHVCAGQTMFKTDDVWKVEGVFFDASLFIWTVVLFQLTRIEFQSSVIVLICIAPLVVVRCFAFRKLYGLDDGASPLNKMLIHLTTTITPTIVLLSHCWLLLDFFVALCGRLGSTVPPDYVIGFVAAACTSLCSMFSVSLIHVGKSLRWLIATLVVCCFCAMLCASSDYGFPYSAEDRFFPTPKRLFMQHTSRDFYDAKSRLIKSDSGIWINGLDYYGVDIDIGPDALKTTPGSPCTGLFCHWPFSIPVESLVKNPKYLPAGPPVLDILKKQPTTLQINRREKNVVSENSTTRVYKELFSFSVNGPHHMSLQVAPLSTKKRQVEISRWSIEGSLDDARIKPSSLTTGLPGVFYTEWFFLYFGSGTNNNIWNPWLEIRVVEDLTQNTSETLLSSPILEIAVSGQYYSDSNAIPVPPMTPALESVHRQLFDWVQAISWVSVYKNYQF